MQHDHRQASSWFWVWQGPSAGFGSRHMRLLSWKLGQGGSSDEGPLVRPGIPEGPVWRLPVPAVRPRESPWPRSRKGGWVEKRKMVPATCFHLYSLPFKGTLNGPATCSHLHRFMHPLIHSLTSPFLPSHAPLSLSSHMLDPVHTLVWSGVWGGGFQNT